MKQINSNSVTNTFGTYSFMSTLLIFLQIVMISKYIFSMLKEITKKTLTNTEQQDTIFAQNGCYILTTLNLVFVIIILNIIQLVLNFVNQNYINQEDFPPFSTKL